MSVLGDGEVDRLLAGVEAADARARRAWPGAPATRQPVQVLYVPADQVRADTPRAAGAEALRLLERHAADGPALAYACGVELEPALADRVHERVVAKLTTEPVEDLRCDAEDGYRPAASGQRGTAWDAATELRDVTAAAAGMAHAVVDGWQAPSCGIRVKSFTDGLARRSVAALEAFVTTFLGVLDGARDAGEATPGLVDGDRLPPGFVVTFPKIVAAEHVAAFASVLAALEAAHDLPAGRLRFEAQIETTASVLGDDGRVVLRDLREAAGGRLAAAHVGVYDHAAGLGLPPASQRLDHPALDHLRDLLQTTFAGTEVRLSDGSTATRPADDTTAEVHRVWARHASDVRHSLAHGYVQGWDLHASHLVSRYAAVYGDVLVGLDDAFERLRAWDADDATGPVMDEPATIRVLEAEVRRAVDCGATTPDEVRDRTGRDVHPRPVALATPAID